MYLAVLGVQRDVPVVGLDVLDVGLDILGVDIGSQDGTWREYYFSGEK